MIEKWKKYFMRKISINKCIRNEKNIKSLLEHHSNNCHRQAPWRDTQSVGESWTGICIASDVFPQLFCNYKEKNHKFPGENLASHHLSQMINVNITGNTHQYHIPLDIMPWEKHIPSVLFFQIMQNFMRKHQTSKPKLRDILKNNSPVLFKSVKGMKGWLS